MTWVFTHPVWGFLAAAGFIFAVEAITELVRCWRKVDRIIEQALHGDAA